MELDNTNKGMDFIRWLGLLPVAVIAAWFAFIIVNILVHFGLGYAGITAEDFLGKLYIMTAGHASMGAAFVYVGAKTAPINRVTVAFVLSGIAIVISGFLIFPAVMVEDWWAVWGGLLVAVGAGITVWTVHTGGN